MSGVLSLSRCSGDAPPEVVRDVKNSLATKAHRSCPDDPFTARSVPSFEP